jgi:hypothetical protein
MEDSTIKGQHMTRETFLAALDFTRRVEDFAWQQGILPLVLLSGGECTEHPDFVWMLETVVAQKLVPVLITNGMWLADDKLKAAILRPEWPHMIVQVTNDPRFYPKAPPACDDPRISFVPSLTVFVTLGRAARKKNPERHGVPERHGPTSFNLRSITRQFGSIEQAVAVLRARAMMGKNGHCTPSISENGDVMAGETRNCFKIGTVQSTSAELTKALVEMRCNRCGLEDDLSQAEKRAIGASSLYLGTE